MKPLKLFIWLQCFHTDGSKDIVRRAGTKVEKRQKLIGYSSFPTAFDR